MSESYVVFVDHPNVLPQQQDNLICFHNCRAQGRFCGEPCTHRDVSSLRQAIQQGYTKARTEAAYPPNWLDRTVRVCHHGLVLLALEEPPVGYVAPEKLPVERAAMEGDSVAYTTRSTAQPGRATCEGNTPRRTASKTLHKHEVLDRATVVAQLTALRREVEAANLPLEKFTPPFALVLSDVCRVLGLTAEEHDKILGPEAAAYVATIRKRRWWPTRGNPWQQLSRLLQQKGQVARRAQ
jgi:hypothetical protein